MSTITVRGLPDEVQQRLKARAAAAGRSMEGEVRAILTESVAAADSRAGLGTRIAGLFADLDWPGAAERERDGAPAAHLG